MENKKFKIGIEEIKKMTMTLDEKKRIFDNIMSSSLPHNQKSPPSPWWKYSFLLNIHKNQLVYYIIIPLIGILTGGGVVFASQESLPDDIFYPTKVNIVEPVVGVLNFFQESKAHYESGLATERLVEAETLANEGKLDGEKEKKINDLLERHTNALNDALAKINKDDSPENVDEIVTTFNAGMNAHARVLEMINDQKNIDSKKENLNNQISRNARISANKVKDSSKNKDEDVSVKYAKKKKVVNSLINSTTIDINNVSSAPTSFNQTIVDNTNETINEAKLFLDEAVNSENKGDSKEAYRTLLDSESAIKEAGIFFQTKLKLDRENDLEDEND